MRRRWPWLVVLVALPLLTCGVCVLGAWWAVGELGLSTGLSSSVTPGGERTEMGAPTNEAGAGGSPRRGGTLELPGAPPTTLDPAQVRDVVSADYMYEIYSGLVTLSPDLEVVPDLAEAWAVSPDGTIYTFTLRTDAVFHDGRPAAAHDVAYAIERACDPATGSPVAETYLGDIVGCRDKLAGRARSVAGVDAPDDGRLVLAIDAPKSYFLAKLTYPTAFALDRRQIEADPDWSLRPNGTGPFRLDTYDPEERIDLARHPDYYGTPAWLDVVSYDLRPIAALTRYENGELDAAPVGVSDIERVRDPLNPLSSEVLEGPGDLGLSYIGFNTRRPPLDDPGVRRALNLALDKERLAEVVLRGAVEPVDTILPPGMPGHTAGLSPNVHDPEAARAALAGSRFGGPEGLPPLTINVSGEGGGSPVAEAVADQLSETLGIAVTVEQTPWETFQRELSEGAYGAYMLGWSADYPDPQDFLDVLFHSRSALNHTGYSNPEVDRLLEAARVETDAAGRLALYAAAERRVLADAPWLPLYTSVDTWLVAPYVHGFTLPAIVRPRMADVWLDGS